MEFLKNCKSIAKNMNRRIKKSVLFIKHRDFSFLQTIYTANSLYIKNILIINITFKVI